MNSVIFRFLSTLVFIWLSVFSLQAQCVTDAGNMSLQVFIACENEQVTVPVTTGEALDANDILLYALHTNAGTSLGAVFAWSQTPEFSFNGQVMSLGLTYFISAVAGNNDGNGGVDLSDPCLSVAAGSPVLWESVPTAVLSGGSLICQGETTDLIFTLTGTAPWVISYQRDGGSPTIVTATSSPFVLPVSESGLYLLLSATDANCGGTVSGSALVNVLDTLSVTDILVQCDTNGSFYSVSFTLLGGDPASYQITPFTGTLTGNVFTSDPLPAGQGYSFEVSNDVACGEVTVANPGVLCDCLSKAGNMDQTPLHVNCGNDSVTALYDDTQQFFDPNDNLVFVLHSSPGAVLALPVIQVSPTPTFTFDPGTMSQGTLYYISAVVGNANPAGGVDFSDPCLSVAPGTPVVFEQTPILVSLTANLPCFGESIVIEPSIFGGAPPYTFYWQFPDGSTSTDPNPTIPPVAGVVMLTITDAGGCHFTASVLITIPPPIECQLTADGVLSCANPEVILNLHCTGGTPPFTFTWNSQWDPIGAPVTQPGVYSITITDSNGCSAISTVTVPFDPTACGLIQGIIAADEDGLCQFDANDSPLHQWVIRASNGSEEIFALSDSVGKYTLYAHAGTYLVEAIFPLNGYWAACHPSLSVTLEDSTDTDTVNFVLEKLVNCPLLEVDISTPFLRRCFGNTYYVNYCNNGTEPAEEAYLEVRFDSLLTVQAASLPFSGPVNGIYTFQLGDVSVGECGSFTIQTHTDCNAVLGQTLCAEAHIFPDSLCTQPNAQWSGAEVVISSECTGTEVIFTITNAGMGDMQTPSFFIVVEDGVMLKTQSFQLTAGGSVSFSFPANGSTYTMLANQVTNFPGLSSPSVTVEACGVDNTGAFTTGFASMFPENDLDPFVSIDCQQVIGSFDPNDKKGFPTGMGDEHLIEVGQPLDYHIRFQNTGTDTAFTVRIEDVLSPSFDLSTFRPGSSSHPYRLEMRGDTLVFLFENILLPDSNVNEPGSHGFVKFHIGQKAELPLGTVIRNEAAIYFDFNDPVITNTTVHRLGENFVTGIREPGAPSLSWQVFPNPFSESVQFVIEGVENQEVIVNLYDPAGRFLLSKKATGGVVKLHRQALQSGIYFFDIEVDGVKAGKGKLTVR
jgi:uncharacterized repeat protein (TIGR01451 family)